MKKGKSKISRSTIAVIIFGLALAMIFSSIVVMMRYSYLLEDGALELSKRLNSDSADKFEEKVNEYEANAQTLANRVLSQPAADNTGFANVLISEKRSEIFDGIMFVRYFNGDTEYDIEGAEFDTTRESPAVLRHVKLGKLTCAGVVDDKEFAISAVAVCVPMPHCEFADSLVVFYPTGDLSTYDGMPDEEYRSAVDYLVACANDGEVVAINAKASDEIGLHNNIFEFLRAKIVQKDVTNGIQSAVAVGSNASYTLMISGQPCVLVMNTVREGGSSPFFVLSIYRSDKLNVSGYMVIRVVLAMLVALVVLVLITIIVLVVIHRRDMIKRTAESEMDAMLGCPNRMKFERMTAEITGRNKATQFAVVVCDVRHYEYLLAQNGTEIMDKVLHYLKLLYSKSLQIDETYGYLNNGRFVMLLHYREMEVLEARLKSMAKLAESYGSQSSDSVRLTLIGGIYLLSSNITPSPQKMIDLAVDAERAASFQFDFGTFRIYNELLHASNTQHDYIELHMDSALANKDFKVFFQAKYNVTNNCPDGAEALVRWYNPELDDYMQPGVFMPLFEANGFITKLDQYMFEEVCDYIRNAMENELHIYPVSVNVSKITVSQPDFLQKYIEIKERYGIPDGFITVEFTESFAYEDFDMVREIVETLHKHGLKCSIDDFGSGYSSYNILKELPMDELKLDRLFLLEGFDDERDMKILSSIIALGRNLNMKVTQEGVETGEQLAMLRKLGVHVIQGYLYSKPLTLTDYTGFLERNIKL